MKRAIDYFCKRVKCIVGLWTCLAVSNRSMDSQNAHLASWTCWVHRRPNLAWSAIFCQRGVASVAQPVAQGTWCAREAALPPRFLHLGPHDLLPLSFSQRSFILLFATASFSLLPALLCLPPSISSMAQQESGAAPNGVLPLIICSECRRRRVVRRVSTVMTSLGKVFYCCPFHKVS
jgi:hypothetical protein